MSARTVQIDLPSGEITGLRRAAVTTSTLAVYDVPRSAISEFLRQPESAQPAALILLDNDVEVDRSPLTILSCTRIGDQLQAYQRSDLEWSRALIVISTTNSFTDVHFEVLLQLMRGTAADRPRAEHDCFHCGQERSALKRMEVECTDALISVRLVLETLGFTRICTAQDEVAAALSK